jgi:glycosyltransferase involved in cell wall biosynthesis
MRILHFIQKKQLRGAEIFACQLSDSLKNLGHEVRVVALYDGDSQLPFDFVETLYARENLFLDFRVLKKIQKIVRDWKPDVIQANAGDTLKFIILSKIFYRWQAPVVLRNASLISKYIQNPIKKRLYSFLVKQVEAVASVSHISANDFKLTFPFAVSKIKVIPIGVVPDSMNVKEAATFGLKDYLLHIGGFTFEKNHIGLLDIFGEILHNNQNVKLVLAGTGPLIDKIRNEIHTRKLDDKVILLGQRADIAFLLSRAKMLLLPSIIEGLPGVILEAMYCKVPVVAYNVGGIREVLSSETGYPVEPDNQKVFITTVLSLLKNDSNQYQYKIDRAYQHVVSNFHIHSVTESFQELYLSVKINMRRF